MSLPLNINFKNCHDDTSALSLDVPQLAAAVCSHTNGLAQDATLGVTAKPEHNSI